MKGDKLFVMIFSYSFVFKVKVLQQISCKPGFTKRGGDLLPNNFTFIGFIKVTLQIVQL